MTFPATAARTPTEVAASIYSSLSLTVRGKPDALVIAVAAVMGGGHLLIEDLPGTGKTLLAKTIAASIGGRFGRIQCTPDLMPSDVSGTSVYSLATSTWTFRPGPVFANVVLVDELNRASPRTQSALLEPMEERRVTVDGTTYELEPPFLCIATQNPASQLGTFPLPESQLDRFALSLSLGLPDRAAEREILLGEGGSERLRGLAAVTSPPELSATITEVGKVFVAEEVLGYLLDLIEAVREHPLVAVGPSPRTVVSVLASSRAVATLYGRAYVTPADVQQVFTAGVAHRISLHEAAGDARGVVDAAMMSVPVPAG
ncbi:MAG: AAA family ATPase [Microthrixaceae bacterium]